MYGRYRYGGHGHAPQHGYPPNGYGGAGPGYAPPIGGSSGMDARPRVGTGRVGSIGAGPGVITAGAGDGAGAGAGVMDDRYADPAVPSSRSPHREKRWARRGESVHDIAAKNFMVVIRVRPPLPREMNGERPFQNVVRVDQSERVITISENLNASLEDAALAGAYTAHTFTFDRVYDQHCNQRKVYETTAKAVVESSLQGYNATIFAYGQTGTGKTYTMEGFNSAEERGIIPRAIEQIFRHIQSSVSPRMRFLVRASYLQIYNEVISDLLKPERSNLVIREDKKKGVFVEGLSEWVVRSPQEIYGLMERGGLMRATGSTRMNELSSRSHAVFIIIAEQSETTYLDERGKELSPEEFHKLVKSRAHGEHGLKRLEANVRQSFKVGKLNLVDLAGSERVRLTGATGQRLEESKKINQSLSALGNVIAALTDKRGRQHIPYRDSKLTRILEDSLGGNCKTTMMAMISPALESFVESLSTLKFANRAKNIKNEARVNEDLDQKSLLRRYERELKRLRSELETRHKNVVDKRKLLELEEEKRRAEADKMAAIRELEARSRAFMREKQEKRKLEHRISVLKGQMLTGGGIKDSPAFRNAIKEHQEKIRAEYEQKLSELEKERETIEEEKAQVDKYKKLLVKQRDIMVMLTQRLNERDEQIVALQDELDAYDRHQQELEEKLDEKSVALIHLQRVTMEHNAASPVKNNELEQALGAWGRGSGRSSGSRNGSNSRGSASGAGAGTDAVPPQLLVTTKQFRPYRKTQTVFSGSGVEPSTSDTNGDDKLLSAEEKIQELTRLVTAAESEQGRLAKVLEEVQAEKVSTEYLLREKLEKIVQSEIEARLAGFRRDDRESPDSHRLKSELDRRNRELAAVRAEHSAAEAEIQRLHRRIAQQSIVSKPDTGPNGPAALQKRLAEMNTQHAAFRADMASRLEEKNSLVKRLEEELQTARSNKDAATRDASTSAAKSNQQLLAKSRQLEQQAQTLQQLRNKCTIHAKERRAIQTIIEQKIKTLVDTIASVAGTAVTGAAGPRLMREVQALQRLVNASVNALRNAEAENNRASNAQQPPPRSAQPPPPRSAATTPATQSAVPATAASVSAQRRAAASAAASSTPAAPAATAATAPSYRYTPSSSSSYTRGAAARSLGTPASAASRGITAASPYTRGHAASTGPATAQRHAYSQRRYGAPATTTTSTPARAGYRTNATIEAMLQSHKAKASWQASRRVGQS